MKENEWKNLLQFIAPEDQERLLGRKGNFIDYRCTRAFEAGAMAYEERLKTGSTVILKE